MTAYANPLNPDAYPGIRKMEAEVVRMAINLFNGDGNACGTVNKFCFKYVQDNFKNLPFLFIFR